jgi:microcompartment protein CcmK/EutM
VKIGRVVGNVVATIQAPVFRRRRMLFCEILDERQEAVRGYTLAVDAVGAGAGEDVLILDEGNSARQVVGEEDAPIRAVIVGIIDQVDLGDA